MTCLKVKKEAKLEECAVPWSGDTLSVCNQCRMSIWDFDYDDFHIEPPIAGENGWSY
jgi:hypothetical protein